MMQSDCPKDLLTEFWLPIPEIMDFVVVGVPAPVLVRIRKKQHMEARIIQV